MSGVISGHFALNCEFSIIAEFYRTAIIENIFSWATK